MDTNRCTLQYEYGEYQSRIEREFPSSIDTYRIVHRESNELVMHSIYDKKPKAIHYNISEDTGTAYTEEYGKIPIDITSCRIWDTPYEITVRVYDKGDSKGLGKKSRKYLDIYGYVEVGYKTLSNKVSLSMDDQKIEITGLKEEERISIDKSNNASNMSARIARNCNPNYLDISGSLITFYRLNPIDSLKIDNTEYTKCVNDVLNN